MTRLERHSQWLLLAYPRWYRHDRGDEIIGTLLESAGPGRAWPPARDVRTVIAGGLRVRAGLDQRLTTMTGFNQALLLAAVLELTQYSTRDLAFVKGEWGHIFPSMLFAWVNLVLGLVTLAVMAGAWTERPKVVASAALATACLWLYQPPGNQLGQAILPVAALACVAVQALRRQRLPRSWTWLAGAWYLGFLLPDIFQATSVRLLSVLGLYAIIAAAIAWCVVDARPLLAVALSLAVGAIAEIIMVSGFRPRSLGLVWLWDLIAGITIAVVIAAIWRLRRQAIL